MALDKFEQGEDIYMEFELQIGGVATDTDDFLTIEVEIFHKFSRINLDTFTLAGGDVHKAAPTTDGIIWVIIPQSETDDAETGIYQFQITTTETDTNYPANTRYRRCIEDCFILGPQS